jgi:hypothetical protein
MEKTTVLNPQLSAGSIYNFNLNVYNRLELFENILKEQLVLEKFLNVDETWKPYYNYD